MFQGHRVQTLQIFPFNLTVADGIASAYSTYSKKLRKFSFNILELKQIRHKKKVMWLE